ncbi:ABC transporter ATP-binding protein [Clostridium sp.]|uniref:ABC transporter ATP-binding protein n=1 Tax=Clostridium sp. TaxID=1506 RepID=UPI001A4B0916|nr:ABC transporter ATP-binding protein [Clostridium sp.]MBK5234919.1 ABC transporter ATP-binding protein [Clostridium sp.]
MDNVLLDIKNLEVWYKTYRGYAEVVNGIDFHVNKGEKVALVGESGCGKTTTMKTVLRVIDKSIFHIPRGEILFRNKDILKMGEGELQKIRRNDISMISQSPAAALNPVFKIGQQIIDIIKYSDHARKLSKDEMRDLAKSAIKSVMISDQDRILNSYPHQLSGGMKQRICIAMALVEPRALLIADEPGTALDVTIQDQIHRLLSALVAERGMSLVMITHSLGVARELVDRIYVMYAGNIAEVATTKELFKNPLHPYTVGLMSCAPRLSGGGIAEGIYGYVPSYINPAPGCRFRTRCPNAIEICSKKRPPLVEVNENHKIACFNFIKT